MTVSLTDAEGRPVSAFGSNSQWSQGAVTNPAEFGNSDLFGRNLARGLSTTPAPISATTAGSTDLGFTDPLKSAPGAHGSPMSPRPPSTATPAPQTAPGKTQTGGTAGQLVKAATDRWGPKDSEQDEAPTDKTPPNPAEAAVTGAVKLGQHLWKGATEGRGSVPGGLFSASGAAEDLAEDA